MAEYTRIQNNFSAGVVDPILFGQINSEIYNAGLRKCYNMIPSSMGYIYRRTGTKYFGLKIDTSNARLTAVRTKHGPMDVIILHNKVICFSESNRVQLSISDGTDFSIPWIDSDLATLDITEMEGNLYVVHPDYPPHVIRTESLNLTTVNSVQVKVAPYSDVYTFPELALSSVLAIGQDFSCKAVEWTDNSSVKFNRAGMYPSCQTFKGSRWYLAGCTDSPNTIYASRTIDANGRYRFNDFYMGDILLKKITASITKTTRYTDTTHSLINSVSYESDSDIEEIRLSPDEYDTPTDSRTLTSKKYYNGDYEVTSSSAYDRMVETTSTESYYIQSDVYEDNAFESTESDMYGSSIVWLLTQQRVIAGTLRSIWMDSGQVATPTTFDMSLTLGTSCAEVKPVIWGSLIIYVTADRKNVKGFYYDDNSAGYKLVDISSHAKSLFTSSIKSIAIVEAEESILWVLLEDGSLLSCTLGNFFGWASHKIGGEAVVLSMYPYINDNGKGTLYLAISRPKRSYVTIESLSVDNITEKVAVDYIDGAFRYEDMADFSNHSFIDNEEILMIDRGNNSSHYVFSGENFKARYIGYKAQSAGYPIDSYMEFLWQELPSQTSQTSLGFKRKINSVALQVYRARCGIVGYISDGQEHIRRLATDGSVNLIKTEQKRDSFGFDIDVEGSDEYYTGLIRMPAPSYTSDTIRSFIEITEPHPLNLQAIENRYVIMEV